MSREIVAFIREQIRTVVDPMFLKLWDKMQKITVSSGVVSMAPSGELLSAIANTPGPFSYPNKSSKYDRIPYEVVIVEEGITQPVYEDIPDQVIDDFDVDFEVEKGRLISLDPLNLKLRYADYRNPQDVFLGVAMNNALPGETVTVQMTGIYEGPLSYLDDNVFYGTTFIGVSGYPASGYNEVFYHSIGAALADSFAITERRSRLFVALD